MRIRFRTILAMLTVVMGVSSNAQAQLTVYTDRAAWEAAVVAAGTTAQNYDFSGLTLGRVTQLDTNYDNRFRIVVDRVSSSSVFNNPGIDVFPDASCSLGSGDCEVFTFNLVDPDTTNPALDGPRVNQLIMPSPIVAFGGDFIQLGYTAGGTPTPTGAVTLSFGGNTVVLTDYVTNPGNGFIGFVSTTPSDTLTFTFEQSGSITNDIFQIYNPAFALAPEGENPADQISDLSSFVISLSLASGVATSLTDQLGEALGLLNLGDTTGACTKLQDFINHVRAQRGKKIPIAQANTLIADATEIRATIGCI